jgi:hypothetical protein
MAFEKACHRRIEHPDALRTSRRSGRMDALEFAFAGMRGAASGAERSVLGDVGIGQGSDKDDPVAPRRKRGGESQPCHSLSARTKYRPDLIAGLTGKSS